nr:sigma-70 family RNA polymerase sigma factor [uncultured Allomuricauda sp.]
MTDQELIDQLKNGNEGCLQHLYQHLGKVKGWISQNSGNDDDALDVFQEAIIVFYKNVMAGKYELRSKISTYLFEVSKRQWLNQLNRRKKYEKQSDGVVVVDWGQEDDEIEFTYKGPSLKKYLMEALEKLGEPCKSLLETTIFLGMRMEDIAEKFDYSGPRSASQQKLRCLKKLRSGISYEVIIGLK